MARVVKSRKHLKSTEDLAREAELVADELADRIYGEKKKTLSTDKKESSALSKRCNFSLTEQVSKEIDDLTAITSRVTRSDVVKASVYAFSMLDLEEQIKIIHLIRN